MVNAYQYGMVHEIELSRDELIRKVVIKYRKSIDRFTTRAVRDLVLIHPHSSIVFVCLGVQSEQIHCINKTLNENSLINWCDTK